MPVDEKRDSLRAVLEKKTTEELEELLALDFSEQEDAEPDVEYIMTIMEVINEREENTNAEEKQAKVDAAWRDFQDYVQERRQAEAEAGITEELSHDHPCKTENGQAPRKRLHVLRYCAAVAAVIVLFCGTAYALGWNVFQALADWTEETFRFWVADQVEPPVESDPFLDVRLAVAKKSDIPVVPVWAPEGTVQVDEINVVDRINQVRIQGAFVTGESEFTIRITIYDAIPENYTATYQKDDTVLQEYVSNNIVYYIMNNNEFCGVTWVNGNVEGSIQGNIKLEELKGMIDSICEE